MIQEQTILQSMKTKVCNCLRNRYVKIFFKFILIILGVIGFIAPYINKPFERDVEYEKIDKTYSEALKKRNAVAVKRKSLDKLFIASKIDSLDYSAKSLPLLIEYGALDKIRKEKKAIKLTYEKQRKVFGFESMYTFLFLFGISIYMLISAIFLILSVYYKGGDKYIMGIIKYFSFIFLINPVFFLIQTFLVKSDSNLTTYYIIIIAITIIVSVIMFKLLNRLESSIRGTREKLKSIPILKNNISTMFDFIYVFRNKHFYNMVEEAYTEDNKEQIYDASKHMEDDLNKMIDDVSQHHQ